MLGRLPVRREATMFENASVGVGSLPGRKSKALWVEEGSVIHTVAYFRNDASYKRFLAAIKGGTGLRLVNPVEDGEGNG